MEAVETLHQKAIRLLNRQLEELQTVRALNFSDPKFTTWRNTTRGMLERFLGKENHHTSGFANIGFITWTISVNPYGVPPPPDYISPEDRREFQEGCAAAEETLKAAIREIEDFGVYEEQPKPTTNKRNRSGGVNQNFHGPVSIQNLAVAADRATQKIEHMGDKTGADLKEIAHLIQQSEELSPRQVKEGLAHIQTVAVEAEKPAEKRNWKAIAESGEAIVELTNKATDLAAKLAPYTPAVITWIEQAKHWIK